MSVFVGTLDGNRLTCRYAGNEPLLPHLTDIEVWTPANLIYWLDRTLQQRDIPQPQMLEWLRRNVEYLTQIRKIDLVHVVIAKYALMHKLLANITAARQKVRKEAFEFFQNETHKTLDFKHPFTFSENMYEGQVYYQGTYQFAKHYVGNHKIPLMDSGEELQCAKAIDAEPAVQFWLRNVAQHHASFRLPTSTDFFYPDFVALLKDGRTLVVEYKGDYGATNDDSKEKATIGEIWARLSKGQALFLLAVKSKDGKPLALQLKEKIRCGPLLAPTF